MVLRGAGLHPDAAARLEEAQRFAEKAASRFFSRKRRARQALEALQDARADLIETA